MGNITLQNKFSMRTWKKVKLSFRKNQNWKTLENLVNETKLILDVDNSDGELYLDKMDIPDNLIQTPHNKCDFQQESILNIPVVLMCSTILHRHRYNKKYLPLGSILRAISKFKEWLYVETVHGEDGYIEVGICLPLSHSSLLTTYSSPVFDAEMTRFINTNVIGNSNTDDTINYSERNIDILYLQVAGIQHRVEKTSRVSLVKIREVENKFTLLARNDYVSNNNQTLSVRRGEIVYLIHAKIKGWFWIRNKENKEGFIPAAITNL